MDYFQEKTVELLKFFIKAKAFDVLMSTKIVLPTTAETMQSRDQISKAFTWPCSQPRETEKDKETSLRRPGGANTEILKLETE